MRRTRHDEGNIRAVLAEVEERTGRSLGGMITGNQIVVMDAPPVGSGRPREYSRREIERLVAWERMRIVGGQSTFTSHRIRQEALDLIPPRCEGGALVLSDGAARWGFLTTEDVGRGVLAVWVHDDCDCIERISAEG